MKNIQSLSQKFLLTTFFVMLVLGISATSVNAQFGNLMSKNAADALEQGNLQLCDAEMTALLKENRNNYAAQVEKAWCSYKMFFGETKYWDALAQAIVKKGKSEKEAKREVNKMSQEAKISISTSLNDVIARNPDYAPAYILRGMLGGWMGKSPDETEKDYIRAIELDPKNYRAYTGRGNIKEGKGDFTGAIADYEKALNLGEYNPLVFESLSKLKKLAGISNNSGVANPRPTAGESPRNQSKNTSSLLGTYYCIYQSKNYDNGILSSNKTAYFRLRETDGAKTYIAAGFDGSPTIGRYTSDAQGAITFENKSIDYFGDTTIYPSKTTPNRFHLKRRNEKSVTPVTCDLVQTEEGENITDSPIYGFIYEKKSPSQTDEKKLREDYFSVMYQVDGSTDSWTPPKPKTKQEEMKDAFDELIKTFRSIQVDVNSEIRYLINPWIARQDNSRSEQVAFLRKYYKWMVERVKSKDYWINAYKERFGEAGMRYASRDIEAMNQFMNEAIESLIRSGANARISRAEIVN